MAFFTELVSEEEAKRTGVFDEARRYGGPISRDWAIDRERNIYLHLVGRGREEFRNRSKWLFFWGDQTLVVSLNMLERKGIRGESGWVHLKVVEIKGQPGELDRKQMFKDFKDALESYKGLGVHSVHPEYSVTLDV